MNTRSAFALGILLSFSLASIGNAAPQFGGGRERVQDSRDRVCIYKDIHFQGWEQCYNVGDEVTSLGDRKGAVSSIRVFGRARVIVYDDTNFRGHQTEFSADVPDLGLRSVNGTKSWSDRIQSLQVVSANSAYNPEPSRNPPPPVFGSNEPNRNRGINEGICVYDRRDFEGREQCWSVGTQVVDLGRSGNWSDKIASIRVFGGATALLYRDIQFRGESVTIDQNVPDLSRISAGGFRNWSRQISSLVVATERGGFPGRGRGRGRF